MHALRQRLKSLWFGLRAKDPDAAVVSFWSGEDTLAAKMVEEVMSLVPDRCHYVVTIGDAPQPVRGVIAIPLSPGTSGDLYLQLRRAFRGHRIGLAPVLFTSTPNPLRSAAFCLAPGKILAYNARLERHHLRLSTAIASALFLGGVPLDRIFLRPKWLCPWKRDRSGFPSGYKVLDGRPLSADRRRVAVLSPHFPYPLSHGGAVRIFHLLREAAREFDLFLFAFTENDSEQEYSPLLEFCAKVILVRKPRYREPRWSTLLPPEVHEYRSPAMKSVLAEFRREHGLDLLQVEYTHLASYGGEILVEHDVTFDLYRQLYDRQLSLFTQWDYRRWKRFETRAIRRYPRVVAMSDKDARVLQEWAHVRVIPNGVDLDRFRPAPERPGMRLLFVGSFRHFPNIAAYCFFTGEIWPTLRTRFPEMTLTVVAGPEHLLFWREYTKSLDPPSGGRICVHGFVRDVSPLYAECNIVIVPTTVSAGTNLKVLEAMAMQRAIVSTSSGCAGLGLDHGKSVWIADDPTEFAAGVARLAENPEQRSDIARNASHIAEQNFSWKALGEKQRALYRELLAR